MGSIRENIEPLVIRKEMLQPFLYIQVIDRYNDAKDLSGATISATMTSDTTGTAIFTDSTSRIEEDDYTEGKFFIRWGKTADGSGWCAT